MLSLNRKQTHANSTLATAMFCVGLFAALTVTSAIAAPPSGGKGKVPTKLVGNILNGKKVYAANGCANCHAILGEGGSGGPDLSTVGADGKHTIAWLRKAIVQPKSIHPNTMMPPYDSLSAKDLTDLCAYMASLKKK